MISEYFKFDGQSSKDKGLYIVSQSNSSSQSSLFGSRNIKSKNRVDKITPFFYGVDNEVISFVLDVAYFDNNMNPAKWTPEKKYEVAKWLVKSQYKELQLSEDLSKYYFAICTDAIENINATNYGYISLTFETNSSYAWTQEYINEFDLSSNEGTQIIQIDNKSNVVDLFYPKLEITVTGGNTSVSLINQSNNNKELSFTGLLTDEVISIDNERRIVLSNKFGSNAFEKKNKNGWLELVQGVNNIAVTGKCVLTVKSRFPIAQ